MIRASSREFTLQAVTLQSAKDLKFTVDGKDGKPDQTMSVAQYFEQQYGRALQHPGLPCVQYGGGARRMFVP